jgi:hypothetical protein
LDVENAIQRIGKVCTTHLECIQKQHLQKNILHFTAILLNKVNNTGLNAAPFFHIKIIKEQHPIYKVSRCKGAKTSENEWGAKTMTLQF